MIALILTKTRLLRIYRIFVNHAGQGDPRSLQQRKEPRDGDGAASRSGTQAILAASGSESRCPDDGDPPADGVHAPCWTDDGLAGRGDHSDRPLSPGSGLPLAGTQVLGEGRSVAGAADQRPDQGKEKRSVCVHRRPDPARPARPADRKHLQHRQPSTAATQGRAVQFLQSSPQELHRWCRGFGPTNSIPSGSFRARANWRCTAASRAIGSGRK